VALGSLDAAGGAVIGAMTSLVTCWFLASVIVNLSWFSVGSAVNSSAIVTTMDKVMPPVTQLEGQVLNLIRDADFPQVFASVTAPPATPYPAPLQSIANAAAGASSTSVMKVLALGACGSDHEGTGFVVGRGEVLTNAHVIAGATQLQVGTHAAQLVAIDTRNDLALLRVATDGHTPLSFLSSVNPATPAAVVGFPLDGALTVTPSVVGGHLTAMSRDIYNKVSFSRDMLVVASVVQPGNSGSPVLVSGRVAGVIFSKSLSQRATAYAVPADIASNFVRSATSVAPVSTGACSR
jgi:S1-C subfamily serine protease